MDKYINQIINADCIDILKQLPDKCIDAIICDLPYGITACSWDVVIPIYDMFNELYRIRKNENTPIVLFGSQPFTSELVFENMKHFEGFKYEWIYQKIAGSNFATAKYCPIKEHENILVFGQKGHRVNYYPIIQERAEGGKKRLENPHKTNSLTSNETMGNIKRNNANKEYDKVFRFPSSVQKFNNREAGARGLHPTQKPLSLIEYLVKTYSLKNDLILDFCSGSGTTAIACHNLKRRFICIEKDYDYWKASVERLKEHQSQLKLF